MNIKYKMQIFLIVLLIFNFQFSIFNSFAQQSSDLKINEIFINNQDNLIDEYGRRVPWMEIFNTSYGGVNIADCYLTNDTTGLSSKNPEDKAHWYRIPKGDTRTIIPQRGYLVFFLDNMPTLGTLHTNFNPIDLQSNNYVALIHPNGQELIHLFSYPEELYFSDKSYGYAVDYGPEIFTRDGVEMQNLEFLEYFSPGATNNHETKPVKEKPKYAVLSVIAATLAIFSTLFLILIMLKSFGKWITDTRSKIIAQKAAKLEAAQVAALARIKGINKPQDNGEELAAITMALHLYLNANRDEESEIITIDMPSPRYSPWAQKGLVMKRVVRK